MSRKILIRKLQSLLLSLQENIWYQKVRALHPLMQICCAIVLISVGILGIILPFLPGLIFILLGGVIILGIRQMQRYSFRLIYLTRLHIFFSRLYLWWKRK